MRGYLKSPGHNYSLDADVTSIGKGSGGQAWTAHGLKNVGAHIPLDSGRVEPIHAVVEKRRDENCFVLMDLNSAYGTYVNEHRVQNGAVKLAPGDVIRFGHGGVPHEFELQTDATRQRTGHQRQTPSPVSPRRSVVESGYLETSEARHARAHSGKGITPYDNITFRPDTAPSSPRNVTLPLSQLLLNERAKSVPQNLKMTSGKQHTSHVVPPATPFGVNAEQLSVGPQNGWITEVQETPEIVEKETTYSKASSIEQESTIEPWYVSMLRDKEQRLLHMGDEISRLSVAEAESRRKDGVIDELRTKVAEMEENLLDFKSNAKAAENERRLLQMGDEINRLSVYERECDRKDKLVAALRDQMAKLEVDRQSLNAELDEYRTNTRITEVEASLPEKSNLHENEDFTNETGTMKRHLGTIDGYLLDVQDQLDQHRRELNLPLPDRRPPDEIIIELKDKLEEKEDVIERMQAELEESKNELSLSCGLIQSLQSDVSAKQHKIDKLNLALQKMTDSWEDAKVEVKALSHKFANLKEEKKHGEVVAMMERELRDVKVQLEVAQRRIAKQSEKIERQGKELKRANRQNKQCFESGELTQTQVRELTTELEDLRRQEQAARVSNEQNQSRLERLRSRVLQALYIAPGTARPETLLGDSEILTTLQKIIDDRSDFHQRLSDMGQDVGSLTTVIGVPESESDTQVNQTDKRASSKSAKKTTKK